MEENLSRAGQNTESSFIFVYLFFLFTFECKIGAF